MSNSPDLKILRDKREEILKAELFMLLHDVGKLQPGHQAKFIRGYTPRYWATKYSHDKDILKHPVWNTLSNCKLSTRVNLPEGQISLRDIISKHHNATENKDGLWAVFARRIDRLDSRWDRDNVIGVYVQPVKEFIEIDSPFGLTKHAYRRVSSTDNLKCSKEQRPWPLFYDGPTKFVEQQNDCLERIFSKLIARVDDYCHISSLIERKARRDVLEVIHAAFQLAAGDTRFSVNDIDLWNHSISTGILYKIIASWAALIEPDLLSNRNFPRGDDDKFLRWFRPQLLPLRINGLAYLAQSNNVPDLLARRKLLQQVYDTWKGILEWEFPLAGEVYRDENGLVFLTFLRDKDSKNPITLAQLNLPPMEDKNNGKDDAKSISPPAYARAKNLEEYLRQAVIYLTQGDLTLSPETPLPTYTQKRSKKEGKKSLGDLLREEQEKGLWFQASINEIANAWRRSKEICSICGLRPVGYGASSSSNRQKAISRGMCGVCLERREERAKPWAQGVHLSSEERFLRSLPETVWLDEVADKNGRIALIVGYFPIEHWLDGSLVESLAMFKQSQGKAKLLPPNRNITVHDENGKSLEVVLGPKPVSYSRIRRVWETTRRFWQDVASTGAPPKVLREWLEGNEFGLELRELWEGPLSLEESLAGKVILEKEKGLRLRIFLKGAVLNSSLGPYHAYELEVQGRKVAVLWVPTDAKDDDGYDLPYRGGFWVIENLEYLEKVYGRSFHALVQALADQKESLTIYEPTEYGRPGETRATFTISADGGVQLVENAYLPLIPILAEPRTFMALVPAESAFDVLKAIKAKYEREMGRVRNRLPLHLGVVFADAHQPLRTILDAGRRMLKQQGMALLWEVCNIKRFGQPNNPNETKGWRALHLLKQQEVLNHHPNQFRVTVGVHLRSSDLGRELIWSLPALMGDGHTEDHWYPYVFWAQDKEGNTEPEKAAVPRTRYYKTDLGNPWNPDHPWLVHAGELKPGDRIYFTPATFDFQWLAAGSDRFGIAYDEQGRRQGLPRRPYLLDDLETLEHIWNTLKEPTSESQIHALVSLIEAKREEWQAAPEDKTFRGFCRDVLVNLEWRTDPWQKESLDAWVDYAAQGWLTDAVEIFHGIMKERVGTQEEANS